MFVRLQVATVAFLPTRLNPQWPFGSISAWARRCDPSLALPAVMLPGSSRIGSRLGGEGRSCRPVRVSLQKPRANQLQGGLAMTIGGEMRVGLVLAILPLLLAADSTLLMLSRARLWGMNDWPGWASAVGPVGSTCELPGLCAWGMRIEALSARSAARPVQKGKTGRSSPLAHDGKSQRVGPSAPIAHWSGGRPCVGVGRQSG